MFKLNSVIDKKKNIVTNQIHIDLILFGVKYFSQLKSNQINDIQNLYSICVCRLELLLCTLSQKDDHIT